MASPLLDEVSVEGMMYWSAATVADCKGRGLLPRRPNRSLFLAMNGGTARLALGVFEMENATTNNGVPTTTSEVGEIMLSFKQMYLHMYSP